jgi:hypothetical protein
METSRQGIAMSHVAVQNTNGKGTRIQGEAGRGKTAAKVFLT